ncbi:MAG TPA: monovalent cation/H(+) antiporter subunit G [Oscillospiraceae bacterium]|nr:monovalent cation/H(+) antiporter subunit G [Oscillospiraceae bacterium]
MINIIAYISFSIAFIFLGLGIFGLFKFPDPYTRMHALGMGDSLGIGFIGLGLFLLSDDWILRIKLVIVLLLFWAINTTMTHLVAKAALLHGTQPDKNTKVERK